MKFTKQLFISLVLVLSACTPVPANRPAEATTAPEATATVLQNSLNVTTTQRNREQPHEPDERVEFEAGTSSIEYSSILPSGLSIKQYVLEAKDGQIMTVNFVSEDVPISLSITSPSGMLLFSEILQTNGSSSGGSVLNLAETGEYLITLTKTDHTPSTYYTVDFTVQ